MILKNLCEKLNSFADEKYYKMDFDKVGLFVGEMSNNIKKAVTATDATMEVIDFAIENQADLILCHHPFTFDPMERVTSEDLLQRKVIKLIKNNIAVYSMHTNLDSAPGGLCDIFADLLKLKNVTPVETKKICYYMFVGSALPEHKDMILKAVFEAGAGSKNNYDNVSFEDNVKCVYTPSANADPFIGSSGEKTKTEEVSFSVLVKESDLEIVKAKYLEVHPYEVPVYYIVKSPEYDEIPSIGRVGYLPFEMTCHELAEYCRKAFESDYAKSYFHADKTKKIRKVGVCSGSGKSLLDNVIAMNCDAYLCGDVRHSDFIKAEENNMFLLDLGHYETECTSSVVLEEYLKKSDSSIEVINFEEVRGNRLVKKLKEIRGL